MVFEGGGGCTGGMLPANVGLPAAKGMAGRGSCRDILLYLAPWKLGGMKGIARLHYA
jgi:hypothetical protein